MTESQIMHDIQLEASKLGCRLFRNNVGQARDASGAVIRFGLCKGSSDLIGWTPTGRFLAIEVKKPGGRIRPGQPEFIAAVRQAGGVSGICYSVEDFRSLLESSL